MATTKVPNNLINLSGDSGAVPWAAGTTAQRPGSPNAGDFRYNTDDSIFEFYNGSTWRQMNTFFIPNPLATQFLVVAGGGGGGKGAYTIGGGAGAGGLRTSYADPSGGGGPRETAPILTSGTTYTITVGAGSASQTQGIASSFTGSDITDITTTGGGLGGGRIWGGTVSPGGDGGSGGGGPSWRPLNANTEGGDGTANEGFDGADCFYYTGNTNLPEGGGGSGAGVATTDMNGGDGLAVSITGSSVTYAGGGASGRTSYSSSGLAATGTGGAGGGGTRGVNGGDAAANTGGGGAGSYSSNQFQNAAGTGGSGVVILRMATSLYSGTTTGSPTVTTDGSDTILTYTGSGTYTH
jgi:hypothetical protein